MKPTEEWTKHFFWLLGNGGVWGVPGSGLIFQRDGDSLALVHRATFEEFSDQHTQVKVKLPNTNQQLQSWQERDLSAIKKRFSAAGIKVKL
jgi:hypothetical protein